MLYLEEHFRHSNEELLYIGHSGEAAHLEFSHRKTSANARYVSKKDVMESLRTRLWDCGRGQSANPVRLDAGLSAQQCVGVTR